MSNYQGDTIRLREPLGTIAIMEWIKKHPIDAKSLYSTFFVGIHKDYLLVSLIKKNSTIEEVCMLDELRKIELVEVFEYKGMRRYSCEIPCSWYFEVDGNVYFCSH